MVRTARLLVYRVCLLLLFHSVLLHADVIPGRWEKVDSLPPGQQIIVTLKAGDIMECSLKESEADDLTVVTSTGSELKIAKSEVLLIVGEKDDDVQDGTLKGLAAGFAGGALIAAMILGAISNNEGGWSTEATAYVLGSGAVGAGIGAAVGFSLDKSLRHGETEVLYQVP